MNKLPGLRNTQKLFKLQFLLAANILVFKTGYGHDFEWCDDLEERGAYWFERFNRPVPTNPNDTLNDTVNIYVNKEAWHGGYEPNDKNINETLKAFKQPAKNIKFLDLITANYGHWKTFHYIFMADPKFFSQCTRLQDYTCNNPGCVGYNKHCFRFLKNDRLFNECMYRLHHETSTGPCFRTSPKQIYSTYINNIQKTSIESLIKSLLERKIAIKGIVLNGDLTELSDAVCLSHIGSRVQREEYDAFTKQSYYFDYWAHKKMGARVYPGLGNSDVDFGTKSFTCSRLMLKWLLEFVEHDSDNIKMNYKLSDLVHYEGSFAYQWLECFDGNRGKCSFTRAKRENMLKTTDL